MTKEITLKDKFSYLYNGYDQFYLVDTSEKIYNVDKMVSKNVWLWKCAVPGDTITIVTNGSYVNIEKLN